MQDVILGPRVDLHTGIHNSLLAIPPSGYSYILDNAMHIFALGEQRSRCSPHRDYHYFEGVDFGRGDELVHTPRWPVLNRSAWVADMDNLGYPLISGRTAVSPSLAAQFSQEWSAEFNRQIQKRMAMMLAAYAHPSCKAIFLHTGEALKSAADWLEELDAGENGHRFLEKAHVVYPAQPPAAIEAVRKKWAEKSTIKVVFCGRDFESKNGDLALHIFDAVRSQYNVEITYIGQLPDHAKSKHSGILEKITYISQCSRQQVLEIFSEAHVLLHPSKFESLGVVFMEAAAAGMAVICAQGGEMPNLGEIFGTGGALFVHRDSLRGVAEEGSFRNHLEYLLQNTCGAQTMGLTNYERTVNGPLSLAARDRVLHRAYDVTSGGPRTKSIRIEDVQTLAGTKLACMSSEAVEEDLDTFLLELDVKSSRFNLSRN